MSSSQLLSTPALVFSSALVRRGRSRGHARPWPAFLSATRIAQLVARQPIWRAGVSTRLLAIGGAVTDTMDDDPFVMRRFLEEGSTSSTGTAPLVFEPRDAPLHTPPNFEFYNPSLVMVDSLYPLSGSTDGRVSSRARSLFGS